MSNVTLNDENFQNEVLDSSEPVLVDFWAAWCAPCRKLSPIIEELGDLYKGRLKIAKLNVDEAATTAAHYGIKSIPTVILFKGGKVAEQIVGFQPKEAFQKILEGQLDDASAAESSA